MRQAIKIFTVMFTITALLAITAPAAMAGPTADERALLGLLNEQRRAAGVDPLAWSGRMATAARRHSHDMIDDNYFSHVSTSGATLPQRLRRAGLKSWGAIGENLAGALSVEVAFGLWLDSPPHLKNMVKPSYTHVGIGVIEGGPYGSMITMDLAQKPSVKARAATSLSRRLRAR